MNTPRSVSRRTADPSPALIWYRRSLLVASLVVVSLIWCVALPWIAAQPKMQEQLEFLKQKGIDPSAMFYTELDAMDPILDKLERRQS